MARSGGRRGARLRRLARRLEGRFLGTLVGVETAVPAVALTFDDGPHPRFTTALLEVLERHDARATFFMVGRAAAAHPELVARVARAGHVVANHTHDHPSLPTLSGRERRAQIRAGARALAPYGLPLLRPPFGHLDRASWFDALRCGQRVVAWTEHCTDWRDDDAETLAARLRAALRPGAIVLLHDALYRSEDAAYETREPLLAALDAVLAERRDWRFVTVPELLALGRPRLRARWRRGDDAWLAALRPGRSAAGADA